MSDSSDPMDCSLPGSSVHGILQAKVLEWGAIAFSKSTPVDDKKKQQNQMLREDEVIDKEGNNTGNTS